MTVKPIDSKKTVHPEVEKTSAPIENPDKISERKIIAAIYKHYGKPKNIIKEKFKLYTSYTTPAGMSLPDWCEGDWQRGRFDVFVGESISNPSIPPEGKGSWFLHVNVNGRVVKTFVGGKLDATIEVN